MVGLYVGHSDNRAGSVDFCKHPKSVVRPAADYVFARDVRSVASLRRLESDDYE
jgi:hypothetical protein